MDKEACELQLCPLSRRIDTLPNGLEVLFAAAKSSLPSPLKSPTAAERGPVPTAKFVTAPKLPVPVPNKTDALLELKFAEARSSFPSPLKSPTAIEIGVLPKVKFATAPKL